MTSVYTNAGSAGGAAASGGMNFQHRFAAWVATHILAEKEAQPPWHLPTTATLEWLRCETEHSVDDLLVGTSDDGLVFVQVKRSLQLSEVEGSDLASAIGQFVRQFVTGLPNTTGERKRNAPLDPAKDRLVLVTSRRSSAPVWLHLRSALDNVRNLTPGQAIDDAAKNTWQRRALEVVRQHVVRVSEDQCGSQPSDDQLRAILSLFHVHVLDLNAGSEGEALAKTLLRTSVLRDPDESDAAWATLVSHVATLAEARGGASRFALKQLLLGAGIRLNAPPSYRSDIEKLRKFSRTTLDALSHLTRINVGNRTEIKIERSVARALRDAVGQDSLLVVGEPGAGKSAVLHEFAEQSLDREQDCVFLPIDRIAARSLGELRTELGLEHDLVDVLENWPGEQPGLVIIDALDAARGEPVGRAIHDLIRLIVKRGCRWRVVASIRKFDLRSSRDTQRLFSGSPNTAFTDPEFEGVRHINVPHLSDEELHQIDAQHPELYRLVEVSPPELKGLLRVPFNLRLMSELLDAGVDARELTPIRTQVELLDRYWRARVVGSDHDGDAREALLRELCEAMVTWRSLRIDRSVVARAETTTHLSFLLSVQVLVEWQHNAEARPNRSTLAFSHNVLFDYAVARLLLRGTNQTLVHRLESARDFAVFALPSVLLHFRHLWMVDDSREAFWRAVFEVIRSDTVPEVGKLLGPTTAAELARTIADVKSLLERLHGANIRQREVAEQALRHLVGALIAPGADQGPLVGSSAGPWAALLEQVSHDLCASTAYPARALLVAICENLEGFTADHRKSAGVAARSLLDFAWSQSLRDSDLVSAGIRCVCLTFESDPQSSGTLLRRCLQAPHIAEHGHEEVLWLANQVGRLAKSSPALVEEIYGSAFTYTEKSTQPTAPIQSRILPLQSTRSQDYKTGLYALANAFPDFLAQAPEHAVRALVVAVGAYTSVKFNRIDGEALDETFHLGGKEAHLVADGSSVWDDGDAYKHDNPVTMLDAFEAFLEKAAQEGDTTCIQRVINTLSDQNRVAVIWRRVLRIGARHPNTVGREILPLAWAVPILVCPDTTTEAGEFLRVVYRNLGQDERKRVEEAILGIPSVLPSERREWGVFVQKRLLSCLDRDALVTGEAKQTLDWLASAGPIQRNEPLVRFTGFPSAAYGEKEYLRDLGVPVDAAQNRRLQEFEQPVAEFAKGYLNDDPSIEEVVRIFPRLRELHCALIRAQEDRVHPEQATHAWGALASACACIARTEELSHQRDVLDFVKRVLLEASHHETPTWNPEWDAQFDESPVLAKPAPRADAAAGLVLLARFSACAHSDVLRAIDRLSRDPVPAVRYQISCRVNVLFDSANDLMWRIVEAVSRSEQSRGVLRGLLATPLPRLAAAAPDRVAKLAWTIYQRVGEGAGAARVRELCMNIITDLYIWWDHAFCRKVVLDVASCPDSDAEAARQVLFRLRRALIYGPVGHPDTKAEAIRKRALDLMGRLLYAARETLREMEQRYGQVPFDQWPKRERETTASLAKLVDGIADEIYFASGTHDGGRRQSEEAVQSITPEAVRLYLEATPILDELAESRLPSVAYKLLQTLEYFLPADPRGVFLHTRRVVVAGRQGGYQYESLVADLIVRLVERYLAEHRELLRDDADCREALVEILDVFVWAGWPNARRLAFRLEEIFR